MEPHVNAFDMVRVQTLRQNSQLLTFFKFTQANCTRSITTHQAHALLELKGWDELRRGTLHTALRSHGFYPILSWQLLSSPGPEPAFGNTMVDRDNKSSRPNPDQKNGDFRANIIVFF
ncbi:hypothetical protein SADUNF_Sadunf10G0159600 [Salix dunnii]|uniref:Uncharacterized protein n=1 Tax=Salix dunnii TaxID=1413687 RepID=A0A835MQ36_9ROSI|nr:hypothetical protein SADUNF_Sadunf10G0159600 [Salix dunnii]